MTPAGTGKRRRRARGGPQEGPANPAEFSLEPFGGEPGSLGLAVTGSLARRGDILSIRFTLSGDLSKLAIPASEKVPLRKDRLWEETCVELFVAVEGSEGYWEFNLSPAGHWNVCRFTRCREGMREEPAFASLPFVVRASPGTLELSADIDIGKIVPADKALAAGPCAVVRTVAGETTRWALVHPGPRPDFHRREGFRMNIPATN